VRSHRPGDTVRADEIDIDHFAPSVSWRSSAMAMNDPGCGR
jgi:hypothetical protein